MFKLIRFGVQVFPLKLKCHIRDQINTIEALWAKACFCSGDKYDVNVNLRKNTKNIGFFSSCRASSKDAQQLKPPQLLKMSLPVCRSCSTWFAKMLHLVFRCNKDVPTWEDPDLTTTPAPGSTTHLTSSTVLISFIFALSIVTKV